MTIDRTLLRLVRNDLDAALKTIGAKHGLIMKCGSGRFTETTATLKVELADNDASDNATSPQEVKGRAAWAQYAYSLGLNKEWLDQEFTSQGDRFKIIGIANSRPKYPVMTRRLSNGGTTFHTLQSVLHTMAFQAQLKKPTAKRAARR